MIGPIKKGDVFTIAGRYTRRTFWQWLMREPRELQRFVVLDDVVAGGITEYVPDNPSLSRVQR
jgi:hypothetical protein